MIEYPKKCDVCGYEWLARKKNPKCCPYCKIRFESPFKRRKKQ